MLDAQVGRSRKPRWVMGGGEADGNVHDRVTQKKTCLPALRMVLMQPSVSLSEKNSPGESSWEYRTALWGPSSSTTLFHDHHPALDQLLPVPRKGSESEKVAQLCLTLCHPTDCIVHGILQARILEWVAFPVSRGSSQPRDQTQVSRIADSLPAEPQGKPKTAGVGSLSLLQGFFPTQESNRGLLHCTQILYQLSYGKGRLPGQVCPDCQSLCLTFGI